MLSSSPLTSSTKTGWSVFYSARQAGKSTLMAKMQLSSMYGKLGVNGMWSPVFSVKPAYKREWCVKVPFQHCAEVRAWFKESLGECGRDRKYRWRENHVKGGTFFLRNETDVLLFRLRWM